MVKIEGRVWIPASFRRKSGKGFRSRLGIGKGAVKGGGGKSDVEGGMGVDGVGSGSGTGTLSEGWLSSRGGVLGACNGAWLGCGCGHV